MPGGQTISVEHPMVRLEISTGMPFDAFVAAFERVAPVFDTEAALRAGRTTGDWNAFEAAVADEPVIFWKIDVTPFFAIAGHRTKCTEYLLGNPVTAESMFRHQPEVLLLRAAAHPGARGRQRPRRLHSGSAERRVRRVRLPEVTDIGVGLDRKVANLLTLIGVDPPEALAGPAG
ncbi:hypothetical protein Misp01_23570 [Microtetraspora sp. NBRC 13810]|uniref:hypothetical protein n=1 Tax=Microtetraspora sp. NBRC 13810 TaxID=3030990 RepID=UPI0024A592CF|nr:hypothetical protein [Microtetraspora sp. NBRC 13810]GLW07227.1 hypothetical protein Misp01_23570 [Microtetraspora sp. NBRC 13810]